MSTSQSNNIKTWKEIMGKSINAIHFQWSQHSNEVTLHLQFNIVWADFVLDICRSILMVPELYRNPNSEFFSQLE